MENHTDSKTALIEWLENRHRDVMELESVALKAMDSGDVDGYRAGMRRKAESLASMAQDCEPLLHALPADLRHNVAGPLKNFSASARTSLQLDSVFYMSALLYPDTHKKGEPDNLELFIASIKS